MNSVSGEVSGGAGSDCEGEEQEDPSSSSSKVIKTEEALEKMKLDDDFKDKEEDALTAFRQQWQRELVSTPSPQRQLPKVVEEKPQETPLPDNDEEKAKQLFLKGVELERGGRVFEAVQQYKRAVTLCPDVELRLYRERDPEPAVTPQEITDLESPQNSEHGSDSDAAEDDDEEEVDLIPRLQRILDRKGVLCEPEFPQQEVHISCLPYEVWAVILRWVVSNELDANSLERAAAVCRGLFLAARDQQIWRSLCLRTWGVECGSPKVHGFESWRGMYIARPRLHLHGCYISKTTYLRHGENAYQDTFYKPWYLIEYYRYLRFFPEGLVLMWTTADEPANCVGQLRHRLNKNVQGIMSGHYRLIGDKVVIVVKKAGADKKPAQSSNTRFRSRRKDSAVEQHEQIFHLELQLRSVKSRRNWQLAWLGYSVSSSRREQRTSFDLLQGRYPPFAFSRVRNYTAEASAPLV